MFFCSRRVFDATRGLFTNDLADKPGYYEYLGRQGNTRTYQPMKPGAWANKIMRKHPSSHVLLYVHGFNTTPITFLEKLASANKHCHRADVSFKGAVIGFDWPSAGRTLPENNITDIFKKYEFDRRMAKAVGPSIVKDVVLPIHAVKTTTKVHMVCHSMGAFVSLNALRGANPNRKKITNLFWIAGDVDQREFINPRQAANIVWNGAKRLTHYYAKSDQILDVSGKTVNKTSLRSGQHGLNMTIRDFSYDVDCEGRYTAKFKNNSVLPSYTHDWYFDDPRLFQDIVLTMHGIAPYAMPTRTGGSANTLIDQQFLA